MERSRPAFKTYRQEDLRLRYLDAGEGPPVVLLHGFTGDAADWDAQRTALADRYRLLVPELHGHGATRAPDGMEGWTIPGIAGDIAALLRRLQLAPAHLAGHSLGGFVALELALRESELFRSLVLVDTHPQPKSAAS